MRGMRGLLPTGDSYTLLKKELLGAQAELRFVLKAQLLMFQGCGSIRGPNELGPRLNSYSPRALRPGVVEDSSLKRIYTARHPTEAHLLPDLLEAQGIPAATRSTNYG